MKNEDELVYGKNAVLAFLSAESKGSVNKLFVAANFHSDKRMEDIKEAAHLKRVPVVVVDRHKLDSMVAEDARHQGVIAQISAFQYLTFKEFLTLFEKEKTRRESAQESLDGLSVAVLDGIEDPQNLGAIIRVAESAGILAVFLPERRSAGLTGTVAKASAGALAHIPIVRVTNLVNTLEALKEQGFWVAGLDGEAKSSIYQSDFKRQLAIVVGGEGQGIGQLVSKHCDFLVSIPMLGKTESLNAATASAIAFFEVVRQNLKSQERKKKDS